VLERLRARTPAAALDAGPLEHDAEPAPPHSADEHAADTVAVLVRSASGEHAGAVSSGGPALALPGRVGDVVVPGAALWVGELGAVAVSGRAEWLLERRLARAVYDRLEITRSARFAATWGIKKATSERVAIAVVDARSAHVEPPAAAAWARVADELDDSSAEEASP
jgi:isoaspartyl peptidase/L-asparaginase-like protein (Ntn-hydrolase superfamily)